MTAPLVESVEAPWEESDKCCELVHSVFGVDMDCDEPATWAFRFKCCGYLKLVCQYHWDDLTSGQGVTPGCQLKCLGCNRLYTNFGEAVSSSWKI